jgi:hypothetical protein
MLAGALVIPLSGCDLLHEPTPAKPAPPTADEVLVDRVSGEIRKVRDLTATVPSAQALTAVHDAHLRALGSPTPSLPASASPTVAPVNAAHLRRAEQTLEARLTDAANRAEDGGLARLLASMAAAIAQQVAVLPLRKPTR